MAPRLLLLNGCLRARSCFLTGYREILHISGTIFRFLLKIITKTRI